MVSANSYQPKQFNLSGLNGISDKTLDMHFKLYEGYVKETNKLTEKISEFISDGNVDQEEMPAYSELTRRLGFEYNGMVLHETFGNFAFAIACRRSRSHCGPTTPTRASTCSSCSTGFTTPPVTSTTSIRARRSRHSLAPRLPGRGSFSPPRLLTIDDSTRRTELIPLWGGKRNEFRSTWG